MLIHTVPCHAMPCHAMPCHAMPYHIIVHHMMLHSTAAPHLLYDMMESVSYWCDMHVVLQCVTYKVWDCTARYNTASCIAEHYSSHSTPIFRSLYNQDGTLCDTASMPLGGRGYIGAYSPEARRERIERFLAKRDKRVWTKKVKYDVRKNFADSRLRVKVRVCKCVFLCLCLSVCNLWWCAQRCMSVRKRN